MKASIASWRQLANRVCAGALAACSLALGKNGWHITILKHQSMS